MESPLQHRGCGAFHVRHAWTTHPPEDTSPVSRQIDSVSRLNFVHGSNNLGQPNLKTCNHAHSPNDDIPNTVWVFPLKTNRPHSHLSPQLLPSTRPLALWITLVIKSQGNEPAGFTQGLECPSADFYMGKWWIKPVQTYQALVPNSQKRRVAFSPWRPRPMRPSS